MAKSAQLIVAQDRTDAVEVPHNVKCVFKPFYVLSVAAVFNNENISTNLLERRNNIRFVAPKARVLVVDDNPINLKVAVGLMRPYHMQVITAQSAEEAISMLRSKDFDIVFMDHMMPEIDGVEATAMIRGMEEDYYKKLPIIALTANAVTGAREMFIESGMNDFVAKPIELSALDKILKAWLPRELMRIPTEEEINAEDRKAFIKPAGEENKMFSPETGMFYAGGDKEAYYSILEMYVKKGPEKLVEIRRLYEEKSWKNYVIEVHALKSTSMTIGAAVLSDMAKELEMAGKNSNYNLIEKKNNSLLEYYEKVIEMGRQYLEEISKDRAAVKENEGETPIEELKQISMDEVLCYVEKICEACEAFDGDEASNICSEISGCACEDTALAPLFKEVKALAEDFEYDEAQKKAKAAAESLKKGRE